MRQIDTRVHTSVQGTVPFKVYGVLRGLYCSTTGSRSFIHEIIVSAAISRHGFMGEVCGLWTTGIDSLTDDAVGQSSEQVLSATICILPARYSRARCIQKRTPNFPSILPVQDRCGP